MLLGQFAQLADSHLEKLGVGREGDVPGLHRGAATGYWAVTRARSLFFKKVPTSWARRRLSFQRMSR